MGSVTRWWSAVGVVGILALGGGARADEVPGAGSDQRPGAVLPEQRARASFTARRTSAPPELDGALDEAAWQEAPVFDRFVQSFPRQGDAPSERTEVRVLYDDRNLYVGVRAHDTQPGRIARALGRRDNPPASDLVMVVVDPGATRRTGYAFSINAGGTLKDTLHYDDTQYNHEWDAIWDARTLVREDGWTAEFIIPLDVLRFTATPEEELVWGLHVRRELRRTSEVLDSTLMPVNANGFVSRFLPLRGLTALTPPRTLQLQPYLAGRSVLRPRSSDRAGQLPRLALPSADLGLDVRAALSSDMSLTATLNPDFGQVEADQVVLNLSNSEMFFPEKRPFFTSGLDLFAPTPVHFGRSPHRLFYSRRIGLETPILGAAKLVGTVADGLEVGVLDAVVAGAANPGRTLSGPGAPEDPELDGRVQFHPLRPFHIGPNGELPEEQPVTRNFLAASVRQRVMENSSVGVGLTDLTPLSPRCGAGGCEETPGATAGALNFDFRNPDGDWVVRGQVSASRRKGNVPAVRLLDGTELRSGDLGWGMYVNAGKLGGEPFRMAAYYEFSSPTLDLNAAGFNPEQNLQGFLLDARWVRSDALGPFRNTVVGTYVVPKWSTDGRWVVLGTDGGMFLGTELPDATKLGMEVNVEGGGNDLREIRGTGIPFEKAGSISLGMGMGTDESRPFSFGANVGGYRNLTRGEVVTLGGVWAGLETTWRPLPALETSVTSTLRRMAYTARYLEGDAETPLLFAALTSPQLSVTLRQQVALSPTLTLQAYAQLFGARRRFGPYYAAEYAGRPVQMTDLRRVAVEDRKDDSEFAQLNLNLVLRWEYRLGSTLFVVYSRSQGNNPDAPLSGKLVAPTLRHGPASDVFMLKWTYLWDARV